MPLRSPETVKTVTVAGSNVNVDLPINPTYDVLQLKLTNATKAQLLNMRLDLNSRLTCDWKTGAAIQMLNDYYGRETAADILTIPFNDDAFQQIEQERYFGLATLGLKTANLSFDFDQAATNPSVKVSALKSPPFPVAGADGKGQWINKTRTHTFTANAGLTEITNLPTPNGAYIKAMHIKKADIVGAELRIDGTIWHDGYENFKDVNDLFLKQAKEKRVPQSGYYHIDFCMDGDMFSALPLSDAINDYRLKLNCTTAGPVEIIIEYLDRFTQSGF